MNKGYDMRHSSTLLMAIIIVCSIHFSIPFSLLAAPYYGKCFNVLQPDGSRVKVKIWGDEFYQRVESLDGYTLIRDKATGWICYATLTPDGSDFVSTGIIYGVSTAREKDHKSLASFTHSEPVFLEAAADIGYYFREWTGTCIDFGIVENPNKARTTFTVEGDCGLVANFELAPLTVFVPDHFTTIQAAIDASGDGLTIIVREGTYIENINFLGKAITLKSTDPNDPEVVANTIIDGNQVDSVVVFENSEDPNCVLQGITIFNGNSSYGGGIYCNDSSPAISNCTISGNTAGNGGGISCYHNSSARITNCTITGNTAKYGGGEGGGISCDQSSPSISNCTISGNTADGGGGIYCYSTSSPDIINSVIWENIPDEIYGGSPLISYSCIKGGYGNPVTTNNIDANPLFLNPNAGDYRLWYASPCIDAGESNAPQLPLTDKDENPRIINGKPDMGAYEYIEMLTLYLGLNLRSFPQGLEWSWLRDQNVPIVKIQTYQPETSSWLTLMPSDEIDFSFSSYKISNIFILESHPFHDPIKVQENLSIIMI